MTTYWLTCRLADKVIGGRSWGDRYNALRDSINGASTKWWIEPTSFYAFESQHSIETLAAHFKKAIAPSEDMFLMRKIDTKDAVICGKVEDQDTFQLMPYLVKA
jgi:hypothetical protein